MSDNSHARDPTANGQMAERRTHPVLLQKPESPHQDVQPGSSEDSLFTKQRLGTYTCIAGRVRESIHLTVLPRSDLDRAHSKNPQTAALRNTSRPLFMTNTGSHIQRFYANSTDALRILQTVSQRTTLPPLSSNSVVESEYLPATEAVSDSAYGRYTELTNSLEQPKIFGPGADFDIFSTTRLPTEAEDKDLQSGRQAILARILQLFGLPLTDGNDFPDQNWASNEVGGGTELILKLNLRDVSPEPLTVRVGWLTGNWSTCSKSCGGSGLQVRIARFPWISSIHYSITVCPITRCDVGCLLCCRCEKWSAKLEWTEGRSKRSHILSASKQDFVHHRQRSLAVLWSVRSGGPLPGKM